MESQISHNLAYLFTSRPKGYSLTMLSKMLKIRLFYKNKENIKYLYLNNFNTNHIIELQNEELNFNLKTRDNSPFYILKEFSYKMPDSNYF